LARRRFRLGTRESAIPRILSTRGDRQRPQPDHQILPTGGKSRTLSGLPNQDLPTREQAIKKSTPQTVDH